MKTYYNTKIGIIELTYEGDTLLGVALVEESGVSQNSDFSDDVISQINEYLEGKRKEFDINYRLEGTEFRKKVWSELLNIPYGEVRTYGDIAKKIGNPKASRAVGSALNKNPLLIVIPCHRVVGKAGLTGFAFGLEIKKFLLSLEK